MYNIIPDDNQIESKEKTEFQLKLDELLTLSLNLYGTKSDYTDEDIWKATFVFMEVFMSKMFDKFKSKLSEDKMKELFKLSGETFYDYVKEFTGVDLKIVKVIYKGK
jgi:hypothetical protein